MLQTKWRIMLRDSLKKLHHQQLMENARRANSLRRFRPNMLEEEIQQCTVYQSLDRRIAPILARINALGINTTGSCEGHWISSAASMSPVFINVLFNDAMLWREFTEAFLWTKWAGCPGVEVYNYAGKYEIKHTI